MGKLLTTNDGISAIGAFMGRLQSFFTGGITFQGKRDTYAQFGYPRALIFQNFLDMYKRNPVAGRVIRAYPDATWNDCPRACDDPEAKPGNDPGEFELQFNTFYENFDLGHYFNRGDRLSSIGRYGIILLGFDGGDKTEMPVVGDRKLLFLQPYHEGSVIVEKLVTDNGDPRYGMPELYRIQRKTEVGYNIVSQTPMLVHWTRVLHIAEQLDEDEVYGTPSLECIFNSLLDLEKVVGSGAETFWLNSRQGLSLNIDKDASVTPEILDKMKDQATEFEHQLRRVMTFKGVTPTPLNALVADPKGHVDGLLDLIAGAKAIPKRILVGSERGELSSAQDESNFSSRVDERRETFASPQILKPFILRMIETGNLPKPKNETDWAIEWPEVAAQNPETMASVAEKKANAIRSYTSAPGAELVVPISEFREMLNLDRDVPEDDTNTEPAPLDESNPNVTAGMIGGTNPQQSALNGLQISSLLEIVQELASKKLAPEAATIILRNAFPLMPQADIDALVAAMKTFEMPVEPPPILGVPKPGVPGAPAMPKPGIPKPPKAP